MRTALLRRRATDFHELVQLRIAAFRIVMEQRQPVDARVHREVYGVANVGMPPAAMAPVLLNGVHGIVHEQGGAARERHELVAPAGRLHVAGRVAEFVVRDVHERLSRLRRWRSAGTRARRRGDAPPAGRRRKPSPLCVSPSTRNSTVDSTSSNVTGNTVGDICSRTARSTAGRSACVLQIVNRFPRAKSGAKYGRPWMWSQCAWLRKMSAMIGAPCALAVSARPSSRMPVPASKISSAPAAVRTSTHGVLPP